MKILEIALTSNPSAHLTAYLTDNCSELEMKRWTRRPAMLVIPGGAYHFLAEREGEPIAQKFSAMGYQTFVLGYTLHPSSREPYEDAVAAMRTIRENAEQWHVASRQICVSGFSAGGNLALWLAAGTSSPDSPDADARPDAIVLGYPSADCEGCAVRPFRALEDGIAEDTWPRLPPAFLWATQEDELVDTWRTVTLWQRLNSAKVPAEMIVFQRGCHGYSTADLATGRVDGHIAHWLPLCIEWLEALFDL